MNTQRLILAVVVVAVLGLGAHFYLAKMDGKHGKYDKHDRQHDAAMVEDEAAMDSEEDDMSSDDTAEEPEDTTPTVPTPSTQTIATPASNPSPSTPEPLAEVEAALSGLDSLFEEEYDDSSVDTSFSGNLDEAL